MQVLENTLGQDQCLKNKKRSIPRGRSYPEPSLPWRSEALVTPPNQSAFQKGRLGTAHRSTELSMALLRGSVHRPESHALRASSSDA